MKSRFLRSRKGDKVSDTVIGFLLLAALAVVILYFVISAIGKTSKNAGEKFTTCGGISVGEGKIGRCIPLTAACDESVNFGCANGQVCCFDQIAVRTAEDAAAVFEVNLKTNLEACQKDLTKCDEATSTIFNLLSTDQVDLIVKKQTSTDALFELRKKTDVLKTIHYAGDICVLKRTGEAEPVVERKENGFAIAIGRTDKGIRIFDPRNIGTDPKGMGEFVSIRHQMPGDQSTPLCVHYRAE